MGIALWEDCVRSEDSTWVCLVVRMGIRNTWDYDPASSWQFWKPI